MKTNDFLLAGAGVIIGYLAVAYFKKNKEAKKEIADAKALQEKTESCNQAVATYMKTLKLSKGSDAEKIKKEKFKECMSGKIL